MASVKVKFRPSTVNGKEGTIYYQVIHKRVIRQIKTDYRILADEWDEKNGTVIIATDGRSSILHSIKERINRDVKRLTTWFTPPMILPTSSTATQTNTCC